MGNVMDMNGYYCQIAVTFTPLQLVGASGREECDAIGGHCAGLEKLVWLVCLSKCSESVW